MSGKRQLFKDAKHEITGQTPVVADLHHDNDETHDAEKPDITQDKGNVFSSYNISKSRYKPIDPHFLNEAQRTALQDPNNPDNDDSPEHSSSHPSLARTLLQVTLRTPAPPTAISIPKEPARSNPIGYGNTFFNQPTYKDYVDGYNNFNKYGFAGLAKSQFKTAAANPYDDGVKCLPTSSNFNVFDTPKKPAPLIPSAFDRSPEDIRSGKIYSPLTDSIRTNAKLDAAPASNALANTRLNDKITIPVQRVGDQSFTMINPITGKPGNEPYLIERVGKDGKVGHGKEYFVGRDGRHFTVINGQPHYREGESASSDETKRRLQATNKIISEWKKTDHPSPAAMVRKLDDIAHSSATVLPPVNPVKDLAKKAFDGVADAGQSTIDLAKKGVDYAKTIAPSLGLNTGP